MKYKKTIHYCLLKINSFWKCIIELAIEQFFCILILIFIRIKGVGVAEGYVDVICTVIFSTAVNSEVPSTKISLIWSLIKIPNVRTKLILFKYQSLCWAAIINNGLRDPSPLKKGSGCGLDCCRWRLPQSCR